MVEPTTAHKLRLNRLNKELTVPAILNTRRPYFYNALPPTLMTEPGQSANTGVCLTVSKSVPSELTAHPHSNPTTECFSLKPIQQHFAKF